MTLCLIVFVDRFVVFFGLRDSYFFFANQHSIRVLTQVLKPVTQVITQTVGMRMGAAVAAVAVARIRIWASERALGTGPGTGP